MRTVEVPREAPDKALPLVSLESPQAIYTQPAAADQIQAPLKKVVRQIRAMVAVVVELLKLVKAAPASLSSASIRRRQHEIRNRN